MTFLGLQTLVPYWGDSNLLFLLSAINAWQASNDLIHAGGFAEAEWTANSGTSGSTGGRTIIEPDKAFLQDCSITRIRYAIKVFDAAANEIKFKVFRWNGATYTMVSETPVITLTGTGSFTYNPVTPIVVQMGDIPGLWIEAGTTTISRSPNASGFYPFLYTAGDITTSDAFATNANYHHEHDWLSNPPYLACTGDSIIEGHNGAVNWHGVEHAVASNTNTNPGGEPTSEPPNQVRAKIGNGTVLQYQNHGLGSQTFAWVNSTGLPACLAVKPKVIWIHAGVVDVSTGRTWAQVEASLNAIKAQLTTQTLLVDEILPWTAGTDLQAATIRTFNTNLATWCAANGATLILCHDTFGQIRISTGQLDNLKTAYDQDGLHLTAAGADALATIIAAIPA